MLSKTYQTRIKKCISPLLPKEAEVFVFGTAARADKFGDVDIAIIGKIDRGLARKVKDALEESDLPYFFDVIDYGRAAKSFRDNINNNKKIWLIKR